MLQIKCPHCQNTMAMNAMPTSGRVSCTRCGQQLVLQAPVKPMAAPQPPKAIPVRPTMEEDEIVLQQPVRAQAVPVGGSTIRPAPGQSARIAKAVPVHQDEYDDRPRSKKKKKKGGNNNTIWLAVGGGTALVVVVIVVLWVATMGGGAGGDKIVLPDQAKAAAIARQQPEAVNPEAPPAKPNRGGGRNRSNEQEDESPYDAPKGSSSTPKEEGTTEQPASFGGGEGGGGGGPVSSSDVYNYVLKSTVYFIVGDEQRPVAEGSGSLIDKKNRLVLTNHHVAGEFSRIVVFFPLYDKNGKLIVEKERFLQQFKTLSSGLHGKVIATDPLRDLCLVQLPSLPPGGEALPVAKQSVRIGERVHSVGNPGASDGLWVYAPGTVRTLYHKKWYSRSDPSEQPKLHEADIIETQSPVNHGDSGGPLVNDRGELVGVTQGGTKEGLSSISMFIDVSEVRRFVEANVQSRLNMTWAPVARPPLSGGSGGGVVAAGRVSDLVKTLTNADASKRAKAAETLGEMGAGAKVAIPSLIKLLTDSDDFTRNVARASLAKIGPPDKSEVSQLGEILRDTAETNVEPRRYAAATLEKMGPDARFVMNDLLKSLADKDSLVRQSAARALGRLGRDAKEFAKTPLEDMLKEEDRDIRMASAEGLASLYGSTGDMESLLKLLKHEDNDIRALSFKALAKLGRNAKPALPQMLEMAKNDSGEIRKATLQVLATLDPADAKPGFLLVTEAVKTGDTETRVAALKLLGALAKDVQSSTVDAVKDLTKEAELRAQALDCLGKITQAHKTGATGKRALGGLVDCLKEEGETGEAAAKVIGDLGADALPALDALILMMDIPGTRVEAADEARVTKYAALIGKMGKAAVRRLRTGLATNKVTCWGCAKALGEIGPAAREALPDLRALAQREQNANQWMVKDIEEAIAKIQGR